MLGCPYVLNRESPRKVHADWKVTARQGEAEGYASRASTSTWGLVCPFPVQK